jgi:hypothetical protein
MRLGSKDVRSMAFPTQDVVALATLRMLEGKIALVVEEWVIVAATAYKQPVAVLLGQLKVDILHASVEIVLVLPNVLGPYCINADIILVLPSQLGPHRIVQTLLQDAEVSLNNIWCS